MNYKWAPALAILALTTAVSMAAPPASLAAAAPSFSDTAGHWAENNIAQAAREGWAAGYPDGRFRPDAPVTRAEFVKLLLAVQGLSPERATAADPCRGDRGRPAGEGEGCRRGQHSDNGAG